VQTVQGMGVKKGVKEPRAADIADNRNLFSAQSHILKGFIQSVGNFIVRTSRAKYGWSFNIKQTIH
jgi:hypothetical protein